MKHNCVTIKNYAVDAESWGIIQNSKNEIIIKDNTGLQRARFKYKEIESSEQLEQILLIWRFINAEVGRMIDDRIAKGAMK